MVEYLMPTDVVVLARGMQAASGSVYRAAWLLAAVYWRSGCAPLPTDEVTQAALLRLPMSSWRPIKASVLLTFSEIAPALEKAYGIQRRNRIAKRRNFEKALAVQGARRVAKLNGSRPGLVPLPLPSQDHAPLHPPDMHVPAGISLPDTRRGQKRQAADAARNGRTFAD